MNPLPKTLWVVWETEYPGNGAVGVEADSEADAKLVYERAGFKDGTAALSVQPLTMAPITPRSAAEQRPLELTTEELADVLKAGHRAVIREADEWRPLAGHVLGLMKLACQDTIEERDQLKGDVRYQCSQSRAFEKEAVAAKAEVAELQRRLEAK